MASLPAPLVAICAPQDFAEPLAELAMAELACRCRIEPTLKAAASHSPALAVIMTAEPGEYAFPVLTIGQGELALPLHAACLLTEMRRLLPRPAEHETPGLWPDYTLNPRQKQLGHKPSGQFIELTEKEISIIVALAQAGEAGLTREQLLKQVWGFESDVDTHTLETHIYRLRGKLRELAETGEPQILATPGGYALPNG